MTLKHLEMEVDDGDGIYSLEEDSFFSFFSFFLFLTGGHN